MYAIKEAVIAKEHAPYPLDTAIFFMDMRTFGKDFELYYNRAKDEHGVRFIRSRIHSIDPLPDGDLAIRFADESGEEKTETFNLVVLSVGMEVSQGARELSATLKVDTNAHDFVATSPFAPVTASRPGIYVCGAMQGPKDIPESVMQASAAAGAVSASLGDVRWTETKTRQAPTPKDIKPEDAPRIGVFVCNCGINIGGIVDVPALSEYAKTLPNVAYVEDNLFTCSQDTQVNMTQIIEEHNLNRVVVAACTPITHEPLFRETLIDAGLNKYLFEMANIRNQDSWVHMKEHDKATDKAKDLVRMAVARASLLKPLTGKAPEHQPAGPGHRRRHRRPQRRPQPGRPGIRDHPPGEGAAVGRHGPPGPQDHRGPGRPGLPGRAGGAGQGPRQDPGAHRRPGGGV